MVLITGQLKSKWERARVRPVHIGRRLYEVSSREPGVSYLVRLAVSETGLPLGECGCRAGQLDRECRHIVAAGVVAMGIRRMRKGAR